MIKALLAHTTEVDDVELAVSEILEQLNIERNLLKNSVGIVLCYLDFIKNGIVRAICEKLPFDVAGINALTNATANGGGPITLSLAVLTSDDVFFSTGVSAPLKHEWLEPMKELYESTSKKHGERPSLILSFAPVALHSTAGDNLVDALDKASDGVPIFGMMPSDFSSALRNPQTILNGETYVDAMTVIVMSGAINPRFTRISIPGENALKKKAVVTSVNGDVLKEINGVPAFEYLKSIGLVRDEEEVNSQTIPLVIYPNDGAEPVARAVFALTPDGDPLMGGLVPEGSTIGLGVISPSDVVDAVSKTIESLDEFSFLLVASCVSRNFILGSDDMAEIDRLQTGLSKDSPFMFVSVGGEICPVRAADGKYVNRFHNYTIVSCAL